MGIMDLFSKSAPSMESVSASAPPLALEGPAMVVLICPNHGRVLGLEAHAPTTCCPTVPTVRADARTVRMAADGTCIGCVRL